jgi:hypothetical protein
MNFIIKAEFHQISSKFREFHQKVFQQNPTKRSSVMVKQINKPNSEKMYYYYLFIYYFFFIIINSPGMELIFKGDLEKFILDK